MVWEVLVINIFEFEIMYFSKPEQVAQIFKKNISLDLL